jgi:hypothetical protein
MPEELHWIGDLVEYPETTKELLLENMEIAELLLRAYEVADDPVERHEMGLDIDMGMRSRQLVHRVVPFADQRIREVQLSLRQDRYIVINEDKYRLEISDEGREVLSAIKTYFTELSHNRRSAKATE